jgi:hypothetical protein
VLAAAESGCSGLSSLNGCAAFGALLAGGCCVLDLSGTKEVSPAAVRWLPRSASTLVRLDFRCTLPSLFDLFSVAASG